VVAAKAVAVFLLLSLSEFLSLTKVFLLTCKRGVDDGWMKKEDKKMKVVRIAYIEHASGTKNRLKSEVWLQTTERAFSAQRRITCPNNFPHSAPSRQCIPDFLYAELRPWRAIRTSELGSMLDGHLEREYPRCSVAMLVSS
jgi:hypothetical protein